MKTKYDYFNELNLEKYTGHWVILSYIKTNAFITGDISNPWPDKEDPSYEIQVEFLTPKGKHDFFGATWMVNNNSMKLNTNLRSIILLSRKLIRILLSG